MFWSLGKFDPPHFSPILRGDIGGERRARVSSTATARHGRGQPVPDPGAPPRRPHTLPPLLDDDRLRRGAPRRRLGALPRPRRVPPPRHRPPRRLAVLRPRLLRRRPIPLRIRAPSPPRRQGRVWLAPPWRRLQGRPEEDQQLRRLPRYQRPPPAPR
ncbi:hypothetical protein EE612_005019 [Oryza sativa]|nr:hypothetical protein EE612_005019 [Oryza sativa]